MNQKPSSFSDKPTLYPPDFSIPPPTFQDSRKTCSEKSAKPENSSSTMRNTSRHERRSSRDRDKSRYSPRPSSSRDSRDYRSQSRYSSSSRSHDNRDYNSRRYDDRSKESLKRKRSRSRDLTRKSPFHRSSSRNSSKHDRTSRTRRSPEHRAPRAPRDAPPRSQRKSSKDPQTERERLLVKWRKNYCETSEQISKKLQELANDEEQASWVRASPADIHYRRTKGDTVESTPRLDTLCSLFDEELSQRAERARAKQTPYQTPLRRRKIRVCRHKCKFS